MGISQWKKKLGGHAGELYVAAELSKRGIPNALLPENFSGDDIIIGRKGGHEMGYIQVKSCHPDHGGNSFRLKPENVEWVNAPKNEYVVFVWLGSSRKNESPRFWIATKQEVGKACELHPARNIERRFLLQARDPRIMVNPTWENRWSLFDSYLSE